MSLSVGIVGLPNVGKSTLFNALLKKQQALAANYPFATIEPNTGIVAVPDPRLGKLAEVVIGGRGLDNSLINEGGLVSLGGKEGESAFISPDLLKKEHLDLKKLPPIVPATVEFVDIAGLVAGASKGEGLGNQFLANIRETDLICHVLRAFEDTDVVLTGEMDPIADLQTVRMELILKDLEFVERKRLEVEKRARAGDKAAGELVQLADVMQSGFNQGRMARQVLDSSQLNLIKDWFLLTAKPEIFVINIGENELQNQDVELMKQAYAQKLETDMNSVIVISAKIEAELAELDPDEQRLYLAEMGISESGINRMAQASYHKLGLMSFLTAGEKECRAWTVKLGTKAPQAAAVIHTDFEKKFIKADVINWQDFVELGGWKKAREVGKVRMEGRDYVVEDGDVIEFRIGA